jgi:hypothetical protein
MGRFHRDAAIAALALGLLLAPEAIYVLRARDGSSRAQVPPAQVEELDLAGILERCAAYCDRLSSAVLDFVCTEKVEESVAPIVLGRAVAVMQGSGPVYYAGGGVSAGRKKRSVYVYDYQLVRDKLGLITETRTLLIDNGRKVEEKNAPLKTRFFQYRYIVMGPVGLLGRDRQAGFDYAVIKESSFKGERVVIIQASPKPGSLWEPLYGKIWVRKGDAAILRIEWQPESMGNYEEIEELAQQLHMKPKLSFASDYGFEKNDVRFPSRYTVEEAYVHSSWRPLVRSRTVVSYDAYKFFTVETGVVIQ